GGALGSDDVRFVAGHLRRRGGEIEIEPTAVVVGSRVVVPAFAAATGEVIAATPSVHDDPLAAAVADAIELCADVVHRGHRHLPPSSAERADRSARQLRTAGLVAASASVTPIADAVRRGDEEIAERWADAQLLLPLTAAQP